MHNNLRDAGIWLGMMGVCSAGLWRYMFTVLKPWGEKNIRETIQLLLDFQHGLKECLQVQHEHLIRLESVLSEQHEHMNRMQSRMEESFIHLNKAIHAVANELKEMREDDRRVWVEQTPSPKESKLGRGAVCSPVGVLSSRAASEAQSSTSVSEFSTSMGSRRGATGRKAAPIFKCASIVAVDGPGRSAHFRYPHGRPNFIKHSSSKEITSSRRTAVLEEDFTTAQ